ncbi:MAG: sulfurtransferase TusA family protein [Rhizobiaceae bacterium]
MSAEILDLRGLKCPLPVMKARKALENRPIGALIWLETTDPLAVIDIPAFCRTDHHDLVDNAKAEGFHRFLVRKGAPA